MKISNLIEQDALLKSLEEIIYLINEDHVCVKIWTSDEKKLIIPQNEFLGKNIISVFGEEFGRPFCDLIDKTIQTKTNNELIYKRPYGNRKGKYHKAKFNYIVQKESDAELISMVVREVDTEQLLQEKYELFENIIAQNWDAIVFADMTGNVEYANEAANKLYGYKGSELIGENVDIFNSKLSHNTDKIVKELTEKGFWNGELIQKKKDNTTFDALLSVQLIINKAGVPLGFFSNSKNITESIESAKRLKQIIEEKEILLKELHHRVKNNLSIIKGILTLQKEQNSNEKEINLIEDFQNRVTAIATLHSSLFDSKDLDRVDFGPFVKELSLNIAETFFTPNKNIKLSIECNSYQVNSSIAIPLGLIINEVLTNSYKHAFENDGQISVSLNTNGNGATIQIKDNGKGFDFEAKKEASLGISLIDGLVDQVDGEFKYENKNGACFELILKD